MTQNLMTPFVAALVALWLAAPLTARAQQVYLGTDVGLGLGRPLATEAGDTDFPTLCDRHLDPDNLFSPAAVAEPDGCSSAASTWTNSFGGATGATAAIALGIGTGVGVRIEAEYLHAGLRYDDTSPVGGPGADIRDKLSQEFVRADERIGKVLVDSLFVNAYYDLPRAGRFRPYVGGGAGLGIVAIDYDGAFSRNLDPDAIRTTDGARYNGVGDEAADRRVLQERIAGTTSTASHTLTDRMLAWQAVVGVDYSMTERAAIGIKARWVRYGTFRGGNEWDQVRSHSSDNGPGTPTVTYTIATDDVGMFAISLTTRYAF